MVLFRAIFFFLIFVMASLAHAESSAVESHIDGYFSAWQKSQQPYASRADLEHYLTFLTEDAAWQHLPYATSDERISGGKEKIRQGMIRWLGSHESYHAELIKAHESAHFIILEFISEATIKNANTGKIETIKRHYLDVLELENSKVAVMRRYDL